jgi:hypothetical protein
LRGFKKKIKPKNNGFCFKVFACGELLAGSPSGWPAPARRWREPCTNQNLIQSIGGRKEEGKLIWDLKDGTGYYTSVDIEDMNMCGYQI